MMPLALLATGAVPATEDAALASLRDPARSFAVRRVASASIERWRREPRLRRASPIAHFLAEACAQAATGSGRLGLVGAFFTGPSRYSRAFFEPVLKDGPGAASPALFPDTVYNSSLSHVASVLGIDGPAYAVIGDDSALVTALSVARTWLTLGTADRVLVAGAEELDAIAVEAYAAAGWLRRGYVPAEGAAALLVGRATDPAAVRITDLFEAPDARTRAELTAARAAVRARIGDEPMHRAGPGAGHAFTASAGWAVQRAAAELPAAAAVWVPIFGPEHGTAAVRLERGVAASPLAG